MTEHIFNFFTVHFHFNSHPHEEDDLLLHWNIVFFHISTHILTRRMTNKDDTLDTLFNISTHILTRRMTSIGSYFWISAGDFNSHPHEEDDRNRDPIYARRRHFNSHPHEEDDAHIRRVWDYIDISTHILTRRMTARNGGFFILKWNFNSHPHEEDD